MWDFYALIGLSVTQKLCVNGCRCGLWWKDAGSIISVQGRMLSLTTGGVWGWSEAAPSHNSLSSPKKPHRGSLETTAHAAQLFSSGFTRSSSEHLLCSIYSINRICTRLDVLLESSDCMVIFDCLPTVMFILPASYSWWLSSNYCLGFRSVMMCWNHSVESLEKCCPLTVVLSHPDYTNTHTHLMTAPGHLKDHLSLSGLFHISLAFPCLLATLRAHATAYSKLIQFTSKHNCSSFIDEMS